MLDIVAQILKALTPGNKLTAEDRADTEARYLLEGCGLGFDNADYAFNRGNGYSPTEALGVTLTNHWTRELRAVTAAHKREIAELMDGLAS